MAYDIPAIRDALAALLNHATTGVTPPTGSRFRAYAYWPDQGPPDYAAFVITAAYTDPAALSMSQITEFTMQATLFAAPLENGVGTAERVLNGFQGNGTRDIWGVLMTGDNNTLGGLASSVICGPWDTSQRKSAWGVDYAGSGLEIRVRAA